MIWSRNASVAPDEIFTTSAAFGSSVVLINRVESRKYVHITYARLCRLLLRFAKHISEPSTWNREELTASEDIHGGTKWSRLMSVRVEMEQPWCLESPEHKATDLFHDVTWSRHLRHISEWTLHWTLFRRLPKCLPLLPVKARRPSTPKVSIPAALLLRLGLILLPWSGTFASPSMPRSGQSQGGFPAFEVQVRTHYLPGTNKHHLWHSEFFTDVDTHWVCYWGYNQTRYFKECPGRPRRQHYSSTNFNSFRPLYVDLLRPSWQGIIWPLVTQTLIYRSLSFDGMGFQFTVLLWRRYCEWGWCEVEVEGYHAASSAGWGCEGCDGSSMLRYFLPSMSDFGGLFKRPHKFKGVVNRLNFLGIEKDI